MKTQVIILVFFLVLIGFNDLDACTVFKLKNGNSVLLGSNEDYKKRNSEIVFVPSCQGRYAYLLLGYNGSVQSGMNEKGLFWDGLRAYPYLKYKNSGQADIGGNVLYHILENCADVDEVIHLFQTYYWDGFYKSQLFLADKSGTSAIITYGKNGLEIKRSEEACQVATNFRILNSSSPKYLYRIGKKRYKKVLDMHEQDSIVSVDRCFAILEQTKQDNPFAQTIYSTVCDLTKGEIHIAINGDFTKVCKINLQEELLTGHHYYKLKDLLETPSNQRGLIYQVDQPEKLFLDQNWKPTEKKRKAKYQRKIEKDPVNKGFIIKDYYKNGNLQGFAHCLSLHPEILHGNYCEFYPNGQKRAEGNFHYRLKNGIWKYWNEEGKLEKRIEFK